MIKSYKKKIELLLLFLIFIESTFLISSNFRETESADFSAPSRPEPSADDPPFEWNYTWGGSAWDEGEGIWCDEDAIYTSGSFQSFGVPGYNISVIKWSKSGSIIWNRTYCTKYNERAYALCGDDTGIYIAGDSYNTEQGDYDFILLKYSFDGDLLFQKYWGGNKRDFPWDMWSDGTYMYVCGYTTSFGATDTSALLLKLDKNLNTVWYRVHKTGKWSTARGVWGDQTGVYITGTTNATFGPDLDILLVKYDHQGNQKWAIHYGEDYRDEGENVWAFGGSVFVIGTLSFNNVGNNRTVILAKWNANGQFQWFKHYKLNYDDFGREIFGTTTALYGGALSYVTGWSFQHLIMKWDYDGNLIWNVTSGGTNSDELFGLYGDSSGVYTTGYSYSYGAGSADFYISKFTEPAQVLTTFVIQPTDNLWIIILIILLMLGAVAVFIIYKFKPWQDNDDKEKRPDHKRYKRQFDQK